MKRILILLGLFCCAPAPLVEAALVVWDGSESTDWFDGDNWTGGSAPGVGDVAHFDGITSLDNNCDVDGAIALTGAGGGIQVDAGYTGTIQFSTGGHAHELGTAGLVIDGGTIHMGDAVFTITGGPLDYLNAAGWTTGTGTITLVQNCTITGDYAQQLYKLTLSPGDPYAITIHSDTDARVEVTNTLTINGAVVLDDVLGVTNAGDIVVNSGASFSGARSLHCEVSTSGHGITTLHSSVTMPAVTLFRPVAGTRLAAGTYGGLVRIRASGTSIALLELDNDIYDFDGGLELENGGTGLVTLDNSTNDPTINVTTITIDLDSTGNIVIDDDGVAVDWDVSGNIVDEDSGGGAFSWTQGTGTKSFIGLGDQVIGTAAAGGLSIGEWDIQKTTSGKVTVDNVTMQFADVDTVGNGNVAVEVDTSTITATADPKNFTGATANSADVDFSDAGNDIDMGSATWTVENGDFDYVDCGTFADNESTLVMKGTGNLLFKDAEPLYNLTSFLAGTSSIPAGSGTSCRVANELTVNGTISVAADVLEPRTTCTMTMGANSSVIGAGSLQFGVPSGGGGLTTFTPGASIDVANVVVHNPAATAVFVGATWDCGTLLRVTAGGADTNTWAPSGTHTFNCPVDFRHVGLAGTLNIDGGNNPVWVLTDDVTWTETVGTVAWTNKGTGTITFSGGNTQAVDLDDQIVEDIIVDKTGSNTLTFGAGWTADSFTFTDGSLDLNGQTVVTAGTGNFTVAPGCTFATGGAGLDGADITVGGTFSANGTPATAIDMTAAAWTLDVTGTGNHCRDVNVANSDASAGSTIYADRSTDGGANDNWVFVPLRGHRSYMRRHPPRMGHSRW